MEKLAPGLDVAEEFLRGVDHLGGKNKPTLDAARNPFFVEAIQAHDLGDDHPLLALWTGLLALGSSPEKLYQSPQFFRYALSEEQEGSSTLALYVIRRRSDHACIGIIPIRKTDQQITFALGPVRLFTRKLRALQIMGSVPLLDPSAPALAADLFKSLLDSHPDCQLLSMQAVPAEEVPALESLPRLSAFVHNGLRDCHTLPLPQDFNTYLQKFSSKKRYNLSRQVRLLGEQAGKIQLCRIETPAQVPMLIEAMQEVLPPHHSGQFVRQTRLELLAQHGILHSYVVRCGSQNVAFIFALRSDEVWHVHKIAALAKYQSLSAGTSTVHLALEDIITHFSFKQADFGYGTPNHEFRATHVLQSRAMVLLCRSRSLTACLLATHAGYQRASGLLITSIKAGLRHVKQRRRAGSRQQSEELKRGL
ncbi:GNAT family N-acetyltransferase [Massilia sp. LjRoot122]|uniref:GNAT family N-acetyltransferase n=1 Tax=Massilia sp. LjRoot122 TaxID=3342257 RepID=UPI003ECCE849